MRYFKQQCVCIYHILYSDAQASKYYACNAWLSFCVKNDSKSTNHVSYAASQSPAFSRRPTVATLAHSQPFCDV